MPDLLTLPTSWTSPDCQTVLDPPRGPWALLHDLPDVFELPYSRREFREAKLADFRRFFPRVALWCDENGLIITSHANDGQPSRACLCLSGPKEKLVAFDAIWGHFLWKWGGVFARRTRDMVMFVVLPPPDDTLLGGFFPHRLSVPPRFSVFSMAQRAVHPFTMFLTDDNLGFHDEGDRATARMIDW